jgi:hypothetical protein
MRKSVAILFAAGAIALAGCSKTGDQWQYETIPGKNDEVLKAPMAEGWEPIGITVGADGQKWFSLKRSTTNPTSHQWQYKSVSGKNDGVVADSLAAGWTIVGTTVLPDGNKWFLLKKRSA